MSKCRHSPLFAGTCGSHCKCFIFVTLPLTICWYQIILFTSDCHLAFFQLDFLASERAGWPMPFPQKFGGGWRKDVVSECILWLWTVLEFPSALWDNSVAGRVSEPQTTCVPLILEVLFQTSGGRNWLTQVHLKNSC